MITLKASVLADPDKSDPDNRLVVLAVRLVEDGESKWSCKVSVPRASQDRHGELMAMEQALAAIAQAVAIAPPQVEALLGQLAIGEGVWVDLTKPPS